MRLGILAAILIVAPASAQSNADERDRQRMIQQSISAYDGPCPCPYNVMRNGRSCGGNSAYTKPGRASPLCYSRDISDAMLRTWRERNRRDG
jgi:hypothetical protein